MPDARWKICSWETPDEEFPFSVMASNRGGTNGEHTLILRTFCERSRPTESLIDFVFIFPLSKLITKRVNPYQHIVLCLRINPLLN